MKNGSAASFRPVWRRIPAGIWAIGFTSLFMDISSEMIHALLPVYMVGAMGASMALVGVIEGVAESIAAITKVFSGTLSDWLGRRKRLAVIGYGLAALTKPIFPLADSIGWLMAARFIDRIGKGIRGAPRDALVADIAPPDLRGASFGLRQSLDTVGAFVGPLLAIALMALSSDNIRLIFWIAVIPAFMCVAVLILAVKEPETTRSARPAKPPFSRSELGRLGAAYWRITFIATLFSLARFSEAFLILKSQDVGLAMVWTPAVLVVMNLVYAFSSYPAGVVADRVNKVTALAVGVVPFVLADLVLAFSPGLMGFAIGVMLWGLHLGLTQGLIASLIAETVPANLRGTGFGVYNMLSGVALLVASAGAGLIWDMAGSATTFVASAGIATLALIGLLVQNH